MDKKETEEPLLTQTKTNSEKTSSLSIQTNGSLTARLGQASVMSSQHLLQESLDEIKRETLASSIEIMRQSLGERQKEKTPQKKEKPLKHCKKKKHKNRSHTCSASCGSCCSCELNCIVS
jgi:hypothetical protein